jgi:predicted ATPase
MYDQLVSEGKVNSDEHQRSIITQLQRIWMGLKSYHPDIKASTSTEEKSQSRGWMSKVAYPFHRKSFFFLCLRDDFSLTSLCSDHLDCWQR